MTGASQSTPEPATEGPCARCIIGAIVGSAVVLGMLFVTARAVGGLVRGVRRSSG